MPLVTGLCGTGPEFGNESSEAIRRLDKADGDRPRSRQLSARANTDAGHQQAGASCLLAACVGPALSCGERSSPPAPQGGSSMALDRRAKAEPPRQCPLTGMTSPRRGNGPVLTIGHLTGDALVVRLGTP